MEGKSEISQEEFPTDSVKGFDDEFFMNESVPMILPTAIKIHSGLWRVCVYYDDLGSGKCAQSHASDEICRNTVNCVFLTV